MPISLDELHRAQRFSRPAILRIVGDNYPAIHRIAYGLAGRASTARQILRLVVQRGLRALPTWRDETAPTRWFLHHTILASRRIVRGAPAAMEDLLVLQSSSAEPAYVAFVRALRSLPVQQREAVLLHHAEHLPMRQVAIAMDCSTEAAGTHLAAGVSALRQVAGDDFERFVRQLDAAYARLTPEENGVALPATIERRISRYVWPRKLWRILSPIVLIGILAALAWSAWRLYSMVDL